MADEQPTTIQPPAPPAMRLSAHPRAQRSIRRLRARAGVAALVIGIVLSVRAGLPAWDAVARGLVGGVVVHLLAWACAVAAWRQIAVAELAAARRRAAERAAA